MFKTALIAAVATATEFNLRAGDFPAVTTPLSFTQPTGQENFTLMADQTKGNPDPPQTGGTENFTIAGLATHPLEVKELNFRCWLFGAKVYDEKFAPSTTQLQPGTVWTATVPFDVPGVAPNTTYDIEIAGQDANGTDLFTVRTAFLFA